LSLQSSKTFYLVESSALPEVYHKVLRTKEMLESGAVSTVSEAVAQTGLSRSAFYKYKDSVYTFHEKSQGQVVSLSFTLRDEPGVVNGLLSVLAQAGCNVLTLHQALPSNRTAIFTVSVETRNSTATNDELYKALAAAAGVLECRVLGSE